MSVRFRIPPHVASEMLGEETVLLDTTSGDFFALNVTGTRAWQLLRDGADLPTIAARLRLEFEVPEAEVTADLDALFAELGRRGLLEREE
ncbi:MAG: PqqD family protein [Polyangiaceae bacterium]|nr:PqqD family protein [Polyangiaceae bacterium]